MAKKKTKWWIWALITGIALLMIAVYFKNKNKPKGEEVEVEEVLARSIKERVSASGKIYPATEVKISSDVSGEVVELYVKEGDSVVAGQILAKIDPDTYVSAVERGKAAVNSSKAQLSTAKAQIENAIAQIEQIKAQLENARTIHKRNEQLRKEGVIAQVEFDQSLANLRGLEANLRASEASSRSAKNQADGQQYSIKSSEASLRELQTSLSRTTIKSPMTGIVSSMSIEKGERVVGTIQMTGTEIMRISNLSNMELQVDVSESDIPKVKLGDEAEIDVDAYVGKKFKGIVSEIANSAANLSQSALATDQVTNFTVKVQIDPSSYKDLISSQNKFPFRPGMSGSVDIFTNQKDNVITVPVQSVTVREKKRENNGQKLTNLKDSDFDEVVFIMEADTVRKAIVTTGIQDDKYIEIISGLKSKENVIFAPYNLVSKDLKEGDKVRLKSTKDDKKKK